MVAAKQEATKPGYKKTKLGWIPEEWQSLKMEEVAIKITDGTHDTPEPTDSGIPYLTAIHVKDGFIDFENCYFVDNKTHQEIYKRCNPERGDLLLVNIGAGTGTPAMINVNFEFSLKNVALIKPNRKKVNPKYLELYQQFVKPRLVHKLLNGGAQPFLSLKEIGKLEIFIPPLAEQQKIAEILSAWDNAIEKTRALIAAKEQQKKALMQQLLTGKKRFREFEGEAWREYHYGDLVKEVRRHVEFDDNQLYPLISVRRRSGGLFHRESLYGHQIKTKDLRLARKGDFLISKMQVLHGATGLTTEEFDGTFISGSYIALVPKDKNKLNIEFFNWLSKMPLFYHHTFIASYGVTIEKMTFEFKYFLTLKVNIPGSIREQQKIAEVLQKADREIALLNQKLSTLQQQKKGLMQKLLTGKVRVKIDEKSAK